MLLDIGEGGGKNISFVGEWFLVGCYRLFLLTDIFIFEKMFEFLKI